ncbi:MAG: hypothetical protein IV107_11625 [Paucibacter sp.]|nr:hypothetical protein [Roseateles sp.]
MKIVVASIESQLNEPFFAQYKEVAVEAIGKYIKAIIEFESSGTKRDLTSGQDNSAEEFIRNHYCEIEKDISNENVKQVLDALRYSFSCYAYNGLHQLYTRQENECWHPKINLTDILEPNDIDSLNPILTLYRGCDRKELESKSFGQSWSTSLEAANEFAYVHYQSQPWFDSGNRVVLKANYLRDHVLYSHQSGEYEIVVNIDKLVDVNIFS